MEKDIKFCPCCDGILLKKVSLAQGVKECSKCKTRFFILITSLGVEAADKKNSDGITKSMSKADPLHSEVVK